MKNVGVLLDDLEEGRSVRLRDDAQLEECVDEQLTTIQLLQYGSDIQRGNLAPRSTILGFLFLCDPTILDANAVGTNREKKDAEECFLQLCEIVRCLWVTSELHPYIEVSICSTYKTILLFDER